MILERKVAKPSGQDLRFFPLAAVVHAQEFLLTEEDYNAIWEASAWKNYGTNIADRERDLEMDRVTIEGKLTSRRSELQEELNAILSSINKFKDKGQVRYLDEFLDDLASIKKNLASLQADGMQSKVTGIA